MFNLFDQLSVSYSRDIKVQDQADSKEKIGNFCLGILRLGMGNTRLVENFCDDNYSILGAIVSSQKNTYHIALRVAAIVLFIIAYRIMIPLSLIGFIATKCSNSYQKVSDSYAKKKQYHLPTDLFLKSCHILDKQSTDGIPRAQGGKTQVFLPVDVAEVVLKNSGECSGRMRLGQMLWIRSILDSQNSSNLIIPKASQHGYFLIEERLPIKVDSYHNMQLYISNPKLFDDAVREMTRLFSKVYLGDLLTYQLIPLGHIEGVEDFVRYDNLPLYISEKNGEKKGKIGLIDLEHIKEGVNSESLTTLARIFPYHLDIIKEEAQKLNMTIDDKSLDSSVEKGKKYLQVGYIDHLEWLKKKDLLAEKNLHSFEISSERMTMITSVVEKELLEFHEGKNALSKKRPSYVENPAPGLLKENPKDLAKELAPSISELIIKNIQTQIEIKRKEDLSKTGKSLTESDIISLRSPVLDRCELGQNVKKLMESKVKSKMGPFELSDMVEQLISVITQELVKGGELFYFDPAYYTQGHNHCWIRY